MYIRLTHPITGRFVGEYDPQRHLLLVVDRGHQGIIDLIRCLPGTITPADAGGTEQGTVPIYE